MATAIKVNVSHEVQTWLDDRSLKPNIDGTVRLVKAVTRDLCSSYYGYQHSILYEPGTTVEAPDYDSTPQCGHGLHFAHTAAAAKSNSYQGIAAPRTLICDVDLESLVVIEGDKVKARFCHVLYEGDETDYRV